MDPYAPKEKPLQGMSSFRTKSTGEYVQAGQWQRLSDLPDVGLVGDGGEARAALVTEEGETLFRVHPSDWVVRTAQEAFEKFTNAEFNEHFQSVVHDTLKMNLNKEKAKNGSHEIYKETRYQEIQRKK